MLINGFSIVDVTNDSI